MEVIRVDGVDYRKVDRDKCEESYENGAIAEVTCVQTDGDVYAKFADSEDCFVLRAEYEVLVEAYPQVSRPIEEEISALKAKITELEARVEAEKKQSEPERVKVGDYAKVVDASASVIYVGDQQARVGDIVKVLHDDNTNCPFRVERLDGSDYGYAKVEALVLATPEEVAEAKAKLAKVEEKAKWKKLGREVGEFKVGDVVKFNGRETGAHGLNRYKGIVTTIIRDTGANSPYKLEKPEFVNTEQDTWTRSSEMELIAPAESVVNLKP